MPVANKLNAKQVENLATPGRYADGQGLYLVVAPTGSKKWVLRYQVDGRRRDMGLGSYARVKLARARELAAEARQQMGRDLDPITERRKARRRVPTFSEAIKTCHADNAPTWRNEKHAAQWLTTLETYVCPDLGDRRVDKITGPDVHGVLAKIWLIKPETARRVRQRIGSVLDWAHAKGYRPDTIDMRSVSKGLPRQPSQQGHHKALPWQDVPAFVGALRTSDASPSVRLGFEFLILTAARSGEMRLARWSEIDFEAKTWTVPADRMKAGRTHMVPLSDRAIEVLHETVKLRRDDSQDGLIFEGGKRGKPMSDMTLTAYLRRAKIDATAHGFRSSFRDWVSDSTMFPREVAEAALAHVIKDKTERAYARSDLFDKRRAMMNAWASFVDTAPTIVVALRRG